MSTLSIAKSRNTKSAAPKKGSGQSKTASRRKVTSPAANAKKPTRSDESKAERVAAAKTLRKADEPKVARLTKQERVLTLLSQPDGASPTRPGDGILPCTTVTELIDCVTSTAVPLSAAICAGVAPACRPGLLN